MMEKEVLCIGAGPAGLTAAYLLAKKGHSVCVIEADPRYVGGISKTVEHKGFRFDIGGHRFFSKSREVEDFWTEILGDEMLVRPRSSRIYYRGKFFSYPLKAFEALFKLGVWETTLCVLSYLKARLSPVKNPKNFEDWVSNQFGRRLFGIFFKSYTEKVWGMDCKDISADWAAQRIKGLSLASAALNALRPKAFKRVGGDVIKTLIDSFRYPRLGPGQMWEETAKRLQEMGGQVLLGRKAVGLQFLPGQKKWMVATESSFGKETFYADEVISSAAITDLVKGLSPKPKSFDLAMRLKYRDFITVAVIVKDRNKFTDNWIYIHEPSVKVGRIQNFKSWSPFLVPDQALNCYGLEYFCFEGDGLWTASDAALGALATEELIQLGLTTPRDIQDFHVVRQRKAYPVYDDEYAANVDAIRQELETNYPGLHLVGRNGMHKYNNQDHAMMTAMLTAENIHADRKLFDVWAVNQDAEYHEKGSAASSSLPGGLREVPRRLPTAEV